MLYIQQRRSLCFPFERLGTSNACGKESAVVEDEHQRIAANPIVLVDYLLDDISDVRSRLVRTLLPFDSPIRHIPQQAAWFVFLLHNQ